ncbi:MAG: hypothetical protein ACW99Q_08125, partial [Candidatus Kariarchaeaceae archaeon]
MKKIEAKGSHYEIGMQLGKYLEDERETGFPPTFPNKILERSIEYVDQIESYTPGLFDEIRGICDTMNFDYRRLVTMELTPYRFQSSCLVMAISGEHTKNRYPVLARNHEYNEEESESLRICHVEPDQRLKSVGFTFSCTLSSRYGGVNEAGLALSSASA